MDRKIGKWKNKRDLIKLLQYREHNAEAGRFLKERSQFSDSLIKRLGLEFELEGHEGCVNCLQWTPDGKHLASGSDDTNVILWDPFRHKQLHVIPTHHIGNIFSVKFLGNNSNIIVTAAGDCKVLVQTLQGSIKNSPILECSCHVNRVKRLATSPEESTMFWSAGEDGKLLQYDLREPHDCGAKSNVLICLPSDSEVKCVAVNPTKPHYIALGGNDCYIRMYDRRKIKLPTFTENTSSSSEPGESSKLEPLDANCVQYYAPGHLAIENATVPNFKLAATYVAFNAAGSELLVNLGGEQIYLFDINNSRSINELKVPQNFSTNTAYLEDRKTASYKMVEYESIYSNKSGSLSDEISGNCCYYMQRAAFCYSRKWTGDVYSATRDYLYVIQHWPKVTGAYTGIIKCLIALKWVEEAKEWLSYFGSIYPSTSHSLESQLVKNLSDQIDLLEHVQKNHNTGTTLQIDDKEKKLRLEARDYELRFLGHCNTTTDIKEANFLGEDGNYVCAGSDEGIIFIWERKLCKIVTALFGDTSIVNCIQPHPSACFIASSGIDPTVKLWSPINEDCTVNERMVMDINLVVEANQQRMSMDPFDSMLVNMGYQRGYGPYQEVPTWCRTC